LSEYDWRWIRSMPLLTEFGLLEFTTALRAFAKRYHGKISCKTPLSHRQSFGCRVAEGVSRQ